MCTIHQGGAGSRSPRAAQRNRRHHVRRLAVMATPMPPAKASKLLIIDYGDDDDDYDDYVMTTIINMMLNTTLQTIFHGSHGFETEPRKEKNCVKREKKSYGCYPMTCVAYLNCLQFPFHKFSGETTGSFIYI